MLDDGTLDMDYFNSILSDNVKFVSLIHQSNVLGTINPIKDMIKKAHEYNALVMIDAAQSISHHQVDVCSGSCSRGYRNHMSGATSSMSSPSTSHMRSYLPIVWVPSNTVIAIATPMPPTAYLRL